eukprot:844686-Prymnesium_polylepis.1
MALYSLDGSRFARWRWTTLEQRQKRDRVRAPARPPPARCQVCALRVCAGCTRQNAAAGRARAKVGGRAAACACSALRLVGSGLHVPLVWPRGR